MGKHGHYLKGIVLEERMTLLSISVRTVLRIGFLTLIVLVPTLVAHAGEEPVIYVEQRATTDVLTVAFSPDGRYVLSGSNDRAVRMWDMRTGEARMLSHQLASKPVVFSADGHQALFAIKGQSVEQPYSVGIWDVASGKELRTVQGSAVSYNGRYTTSYDEPSKWTTSTYVKLIDVSSGQELWKINITKRADQTFYGTVARAVSADGRYLAAGRGDRTVQLWEWSTGKKVWESTVQENITTLTFSPDDRYVLGNEGSMMKLWEAASGRVVRIYQGHAERVSSAEFSRDGRYIVSGSDDQTVRIWDMANGNIIRTLKGDMGVVSSVAFSPDSKQVIAGCDGGATHLWEIATGRQLCKMIGFKDGEWLTMTQDGVFIASRNGAKHLKAAVNFKAYSIDQFYSKFYRPELVRLALAGKYSGKTESFKDVLVKKMAPTVNIVSPVSDSSIDKDSVTISLEIYDNGGGIGDVNVYLNGAQVANDTRSITVKEKDAVAEKTLSFTIPLMDGKNEIKAIAMNRDGSMESAPAIVTVTSRAVLAKPNLHGLIIGINQYKNRSISLTYAVPDAKAFAETLRKTAAPLFAKTDIHVLASPEATTKDAIAKAFEDIRTKVKPNDLFVFYDASHGVVDVVDGEEQYFLLTSNVLLLSSRHIGKDAIGQKELASLIGSIPAQKKLVVLDTCQAGKGGKEIQVALLQQTRGLTESTAVKLLQRAIGSAVFSASSDTQLALEGYKGHGLFTYVLLEGLRGKADLKKDGYITVLGLADYVEEEVTKLSEVVFKRQQTPTIQTGANFPIGKVY